MTCPVPRDRAWIGTALSPKPHPFHHAKPPCISGFADLKLKGGKEKGFLPGVLNESAGGQEAARKHPPPRPTASEVGEHADDERHLVTGERAQGSLLGWEPGMAALAARARPWRSSFCFLFPT